MQRNTAFGRQRITRALRPTRARDHQTKRAIAQRRTRLRAANSAINFLRTDQQILRRLWHRTRQTRNNRHQISPRQSPDARDVELSSLACIMHRKRAATVNQRPLIIAQCPQRTRQSGAHIGGLNLAQIKRPLPLRLPHCAQRHSISQPIWQVQIKRLHLTEFQFCNCAIRQCTNKGHIKTACNCTNSHRDIALPNSRQIFQRCLNFLSTRICGQRRSHLRSKRKRKHIRRHR